MKQGHSWRRSAFLLLAAAALLAACGGGGGGGGSASNNGGSEVPNSALQSVDGLVAYLQDLITNRTDETSEPVVLGDVVLPTSDTRDPL